MAEKKYTAKEILENALRMEGEARAAGLNEARNALRSEMGLQNTPTQAGQTGAPAGTEALTPTQGYLKYLDAYKNNKFQYDQNTDPYYLQAREAAMRQGQLASKDVQAQAAQLTGGYGNSYGAMAAGQAYNQYLQSVNDMVPELEQNAYARYQDEQNRNLTLTQMYLQQEERDYNRRMNEAQLAAQYGDYGGLNGLGIDTSEYENKEALDRAWELETRDRQRTEWTQDDEARMWQFALQYAQYGDYTKLKDLGVDVSTQQRRDALEEALQYAQVYDYSKLRALGVNTDLLEAQKAATMAELYGTGSGGSGSGSGSGSGRTGRSTSGGTDETENEGDITDDFFFAKDKYNEDYIYIAKDTALREGYRKLSYDRNTNTVTGIKDGKTVYFKYDPKSKTVIMGEA